MPRTMLPPLHGGKIKWIKLKKVERTETAITGTADVDFIYSAKVYIDRRTGTISINGKAGSYSGECWRPAVPKIATPF